MLFFKSKKKNEEKEPEQIIVPAEIKAEPEETFENAETDSDAPSLMDIASIISNKGYTVYSYDQGRKQLEKKLRQNIK